MSIKSERKKQIKAISISGRKKQKAVNLLGESTDALIHDAPTLLAAGDFDAVAKLGATHGAYYLGAEILNGAADDDTTFAPELFFYDKTNKLKGIVALEGANGKQTKDAIDLAFNKKTKFRNPELRSPKVILAVSPGWFSRSAATSRKRASKQPDRISAGIGGVYIAPGKLVAGTVLPVGTPTAVKRAGIGIAVKPTKKVA